MLVISFHSLNGSGTTSDASFIFFSSNRMPYYHMGANGVDFKAFDVHSLILVIKLSSASRQETAPPRIQSGYSKG